MSQEELMIEFVRRYKSFESESFENSNVGHKLQELISRMKPSFFSENVSDLGIEVLSYLFKLTVEIENNYDGPLGKYALDLLCNIFCKRCVGNCIEAKNVLFFTNNLLTFLTKHLYHADDNEIEKRLSILQYLTYGIQVQQVDNQLQSLISLITGYIIKDSKKHLLKSCLIVLQNFIRKNDCVKAYIREEDDLHQLYRCLLEMFDDRDLITRIITMSIYTSLDPEIEKLYLTANSGHAIEVIFSVILHGHNDAVVYAADLFMDLLAKEGFRRLFLKSKYMNIYLEKLVAHMATLSDMELISKVYELLLNLCAFENFNKTIMKIIFEAKNQKCSLALAAHWFCKELQRSEVANYYSALFFNHLLKEILNSDALHDYNLDDQIEDLSKQIDHQFQSYDQIQSINGASCEKILVILNVLSSLCMNEDFFKKLANCMNINHSLESILEMYLKCFGGSKLNLLKNYNLTCGIVDVIIAALMVANQLKSGVESLQDTFHKFVQDSRLMPVLAKAFKLDSKSRIQNSLFLINIGLKLPNFPQMKLYEVISKSNEETKNKNIECICGDPLKGAVQRKIRSTNFTFEESVENLISSFKKDMDIRNVRPSQIMDIYEHKIQTLELKCQQFEQLLDTKSKTLEKAESIIANYRYRWAQDEGLENLHLRNLLHEAEKRNESSNEEVSQVKVELKSFKLKLQTAIADLELMDVERKNSDLKGKNLMKQLDDCKKEIEMIKEETKVMEAENENKKIKLVKSIEKLEAEKQKTLKDQKEMIKSFDNLKNKSQNLEGKLEKSESENTKMTEQIQQLSKQLQKMTADNAELKDKLRVKEDERKEMEEKYNDEMQEHSHLKELLSNVSTMIGGKKDKEKFHSRNS